jgi:hypothetical protein
VADPICLSRIPDPKTAMKDRGEKKFVIPFFGDINFTKLNYFIFEILKKKNLGQFSKNYRTFYPKYCLWVWDPRSGIQKKPIQDPGSRGQKCNGSRIRIRNTVFLS